MLWDEKVIPFPLIRLITTRNSAYRLNDKRTIVLHLGIFGDCPRKAVCSSFIERCKQMLKGETFFYCVFIRNLIDFRC